MSEHPAFAWLQAKLTQVEETARAADSGPWKLADGGYYGQPHVQIGEDPGNHWEREYEYNGDAAWRCDDPDDTCADVREYERAEAQLIATQADPAAVLRQVAGARAILAEHANDYGDCSACARASDESDGRGNAFHEPLPWPCRTVLLLAEGWGWTAP